VILCIRIHYTALNELLLISGHNMFENGWQITNQAYRCSTHNARFSNLLCAAQLSSNDQIPDNTTVPLQPLSSQSYITKPIIFLTSVEKSMIRRTCVLRANLNLGWTLRYSSACDSHLFRNKVLMPGEGGVNA